MKFAIDLPNFNELSEAKTVAEIAREAEQAGWDGLFLWDQMVFARRPPLPICDPWIALTAAAMATERIKLGPMVSPLSRRRPWKVARETVTLDRLSGGRLVLGVGLGDPVEDDFGAFGEATY